MFGLPAVVAVNRFNTDTPQELEIIKRGCMHAGVQAVICDSWARGGAGAAQLAEAAAELCYREKAFKLAYDTNNSLYEKLRLVACNIYGLSLIHIYISLTFWRRKRTRPELKLNWA